jgi:uncharacterized OB-fold protein
MAELQKAPELISETQFFWDGTAASKLMLKRCLDTGKHFFYPRDRSPFTGGATEWVEASGRGTVYSCSASLRPSPSCLAYVQLEEGPIILSQVVTEDVNAVAIGDPVQVSFRPADGEITVAVFTVVK